MTISERLLRKWRKEALHFEKDILGSEKTLTNEPVSELYRKVLLMTRELLDQHLLRK